MQSIRQLDKDNANIILNHSDEELTQTFQLMEITVALAIPARLLFDPLELRDAFDQDQDL